MRRFTNDALDALEEIVLSLGIGIGVFSLCLLFLGTLISFSLIFLRFVAGAAFIFALISNWRIKQKPLLFFSLPRFIPTRAVIPIVAFGLIALNFIGALGPEIFFDSLTYHLALPQLYLLHGKIFPTPYNIYSGIPFNSEMLYGLSLSVGGEVLAKMLPWGLSLAIAGLILIWCRRFVSEEAGWMAALLFYSCPMIAVQTWNSLVELHWCFFAVLALFCVMLSGEQESAKGRMLALAGIFMGFCLGVKYNAVSVIFPILITAFVVSRSKDRGLNESIRNILLLIAIAVVLVSPWLIKNWVFYHNPIYPFLNDSFSSAPTGVNWRGLVQDAKSRDLLAAFTTPSGFVDMAASLWGKEWNGLDAVGITLLLALPLLALVKGAGRCRIHVVMFCCSWFAWALTSRMPRFAIYAIPLLAIALAAALDSLKKNGMYYSVANALVLSACLLNCGEIFNYWMNNGTWRAVIGGEDRAQYLETSHRLYPTPYYAAAEFINKTLPAHAKILFFEESRGYYCEREFVATSPFAVNPFVRMVETSSSPEELLRKFKEENITHMLVNHANIYIRGRTGTLLTKRGKELFSDFRQRHLKLIFERRVGMDPLDPLNAQWVQVLELI